MDLVNYKNHHSLQNKIGRAAWFITYWLFFRPFIGRIFKHWRNFLLRCFGAKIHGKPYIFASVRIWAPWNLEIGNACISYHSYVYNVAKISIGDNCVISHNVHLCSASHDISSKTYDLTSAPITVKDQVWIAADAFIGPGVTIEQGSVIAARAVVVKDVSPWSVMAGNPAKFIKQRVLEL